MSMPRALSCDRVTLSTVLPTESNTPIASRTDHSTKTATTATIARAIESRNASFMTDQGSTRLSTRRARRARTRAAGRAWVAPASVSVTGDMVAVGGPPRHSLPELWGVLTTRLASSRASLGRCPVRVLRSGVPPGDLGRGLDRRLHRLHRLLGLAQRLVRLVFDGSPLGVTSDRHDRVVVGERDEPHTHGDTSGGVDLPDGDPR